MENLKLLVILLQTVASLLSDPATARNAQVQILAQQAISMASQAIQSTQIVEPIGIGGPVETPVITQPVVQPSCNLHAVFTQLDPPRTIISWELTGLPDTTRGKISDTISAFSEDGDTGLSLLNQPVGPYPNQNQTIVPIHFQYGVRADFNGTKCWVYPENN